MAFVSQCRDRPWISAQRCSGREPLIAMIALGCPGPNQAKACTRCGMGPCQGRMCGLAVSELMAAARGVSVPEVGHYRVRPPIKPVTVGEIAALGGVEAEVSDLGGLPSMRRS